MNVRLVNKEQFITRDEGEKTELRKKVQFYLFPVPPYLHSSNLYWISVYTFKLPQPHYRIWKMPCHLFSCLHQWKNYPFILWIININCDYCADSAAYGHWSAGIDKNNIPSIVININISLLSIIFDYIFDMLQTVQRMISWEDSSTRNSFPQHRLWADFFQYLFLIYLIYLYLIIYNKNCSYLLSGCAL